MIGIILGLLLVVVLILLIHQCRVVKRLRADKEEEFRKYLDQKYCWLCEKVDVLEEKKLSYTDELKALKSDLEDFRSRRESVNEAIRREREIKEKVDFYRIQLSEDDKEDIELLKSMGPRLRHKELIPKLIWDSIASRPTNEMIKRVVGNKIGGIYKITYIPTGEAYVGRTVNFKDRWKSHVQTALGLQKIATSTLHTHMARNGLWNYTFEILEEVPKEKQSEREKFYIDLYGTKSQLNMRAGG